MNAHQKYLNYYAQNIKSDSEITKYFVEKKNICGTIIRSELEKGIEMLFFYYSVKEDQEAYGFEKGNLMEIFYCLCGTIEMKHSNHMVELKDNMLGIYDFNTCPEAVIMKKGRVKGISLLLDIDVADIIIRKHLSENTLTMKQFQERIEKHQKLFLAFGNQNLKSVFIGIAENPFDYDKEYLLLKALELVLIGSNSLKQDSQSSGKNVKRTKRYQLYEKVITYMEYYISEPITIQKIAEEMGVTKGQLNQCFMEYANQTAYSYLKELRLQRGKELLLQTELSVTEIAGEIGWLNASKFAAVFKEKYKMTPQTFRKENKLI